MFSLGTRKIIVLSLIGATLLLGNILLVANWLKEHGLIARAQDFRHEYLTGTALMIIAVLLFLLVKPRTEPAGRIHRCPVCDHTIRGNQSYCCDCGSKL